MSIAVAERLVGSEKKLGTNNDGKLLELLNEEPHMVEEKKIRLVAKIFVIQSAIGITALTVVWVLLLLNR